MQRSLDTRRALEIAGALAAAAAGGMYLAERRNAKRVAADPNNAFLTQPPRGEPRTVESADGTSLHVEIFGPDGAPTIVLSHGWTESIGYWIYEIAELSGEFRLVAFDHRGHARSGRSPIGEYTLGRFGEDIEAVLQACVPADERAVIAGHSLGAMSIAAWAEQHDVKRRVRAAAMINTGVGDLLTEQLLLRSPQFAKALTDPISRRAFLGSRAPLPRVSSAVPHALIRFTAFGPAATPAQIAYFERMLRTCAPDVRAEVGLAMADMDLSHALANLNVPTVVIAGDRDKLTPPSHAERIAAELPQLAGLVILEQTGHMAPLERPSEISQALRELALTTADARPATASATA